MLGGLNITEYFWSSHLQCEHSIENHIIVERTKKTHRIMITTKPDNNNMCRVSLYWEQGHPFVWVNSLGFVGLIWLLLLQNCSKKHRKCNNEILFCLPSIMFISSEHQCNISSKSNLNIAPDITHKFQIQQPEKPHLYIIKKHVSNVDVTIVSEIIAKNRPWWKITGSKSR